MATRTEKALHSFRCDSCGTAIPEGAYYRVLVAHLPEGETESQNLCMGCGEGYERSRLIHNYYQEENHIHRVYPWMKA